MYWIRVLIDLVGWPSFVVIDLLYNLNSLRSYSCYVWICNIFPFLHARGVAVEPTSKGICHISPIQVNNMFFFFFFHASFSPSEGFEKYYLIYPVDLNFKQT